MFFLSNLLLSFLAAISPGPNMLMVANNSAKNGKIKGLYTALGVIVGVFFWMLFLIFFSLEIEKYTSLKKAFTTLSGFYFLYLSIKFLQTPKLHHIQNQKNLKFFLSSFISTILNIEIAIFYGSIMLRVSNFYQTNTMFHLFYSAISFLLIEACVFISIALFIQKITQKLQNTAKLINLLCSLLMMFFAFSIIYSLLQK